MTLAIPNNTLRDVFEKHLDQHDQPRGLNSLRQRAIERFQSTGWPTTKDEAWRFTNPKAIATGNFELAEEVHQACDGDAIAPYYLSEPCLRLVFVDGFLRKDLSDLDEDANGCCFEPLNQQLAAEDVLEALTIFQSAAAQFGSLNTALFSNGAVLRIPDNHVEEKPFHILHVQTQRSMIHPRVLVFAGKHSQAKVVETFVGAEDSVYWMNNVTQLHLADGAQLQHYLVGLDSESAYHTANLNARLQATSKLTCHHLLTGAKLMRNNLNLHLLGQGSECEVNGLTLGHNQQTLDNHVEMNHVVPHCHSQQYFKTILDHKAHGIFGGRVVVFQDAQKTDAQQSNRNLLLSDDARIDTKPQLEIYADDVKCAHGATTGQIDNDALFYLASRGLAPKAAREIMLYAFAHELLDRLEIPSILAQAETVLLSRFSQSHLFGD